MRTYLIVAVSVGIGCIIGSRLWTVPDRMDAVGPSIETPITEAADPITVTPEPPQTVPEPALTGEPMAPTMAEASVPEPAIVPLTESTPEAREEARLAVIRELRNWEAALFPPVGEITFIGTGDDGFDNYQYQSENAQVHQWKKGEDLFVEQIEFPNGDRVVRRSELDESLQPSVSYSRPDGTGGSIYFNARREVESFIHREKDRSTSYFYDEHGNVKDAFTFR